MGFIESGLSFLCVQGVQLRGGPGRGGISPCAGPRYPQPLRMAGGQGIRGESMVGLRPGIGPSLSPASRVQPHMAIAAVAAANINSNQKSGVRFSHPHQFLQQHNLRAPVSGMMPGQLQQQQQLQLQMQQQLQKQLQQNPQHQQQHQQHRPPCLPPNMALRSTGMSNPGFGANSRMPQPGPSNGLSPRPPFPWQHFDGPVPGQSPPFRNHRPPFKDQRNIDERGPQEWARNRPVNAGSRFPMNSQHLSQGNKDDKFSSQKDGNLKVVNPDQDNNRKCRISPDRRTSYSFDGSYISDSLSSRTDTDSSSRGTPVSWESQSHSPRKRQASDADGGYGHRPSSTRYSRDKRDCSYASDSASSRDLLDSELEEDKATFEHGPRDGKGYRKDKRSDWRRSREEYSGLPGKSNKWEAPQSAGFDERGRGGWKRRRDDYQDSDLDMDFDERSVQPRMTHCSVDCHQPVAHYITTASKVKVFLYVRASFTAGH